MIPLGLFATDRACQRLRSELNPISARPSYTDTCGDLRRFQYQYAAQREDKLCRNKKKSRQAHRSRQSGDGQLASSRVSRMIVERNDDS